MAFALSWGGLHAPTLGGSLPNLGPGAAFRPVYVGNRRRSPMLLILGIVLLVIAIAGGAIIHPVLFAIGIVALVMFFMHHSGRRTAL
jgi:hypothetical protein